MKLSNIQSFIDELGYIWDIGQIDKESLKWLKSQVKLGKLGKSKAFWPYFNVGTCRKTYYFIKVVDMEKFN